MEIASAFVSILPSAKGFGSKLQADVGRETDGAGSKLGGTFGKAFAIAGGAIAAAGIGGFIKDAIGQASDLNESTTKISAIFGKAAGNVQQFASQGATALGQTKLEVLDAAATFGTFGKAAGLSGKDLAKFSTGFAGLSTDMASFFNTSPEQAVEAIGAALRGEAEPIRQYGVLLDDATLRNEALKLGLISTTKQALTPQQKVLAAQAAIYKQTKDAQGDFQRTSGGLANQQRILSAQWSDMKTRLGGALLPATVKVVTALNNGLAPAISLVGKGFNAAKAFLAPFIAQVQTFFAGAGKSAISGFVTQAVGVFQTRLLPMIQQAGVFFQTKLLPAVVAFGSYVATNLWPILQRLAQIFVVQVLPILSSFASFITTTVWPALLRIYQAVAANLKPVFDQLVVTFQSRVLPSLQTLLARFREWQPTIQRVIAVVVKVIGKMLEFSAAILGKVLPVVIRFAGWLLSKLVPAVLNVIGFIARLIGIVIRVGSAFVSAVAFVVRFQVGVVKTVGKVVAFVATIPSKILHALGDVGSLLKNSGAKIIEGLVTGIKNGAGRVYDAVKDVLAKARKLLPFSPAKEGPFSGKGWTLHSGRSLMEGLADGISRSSGKVQNALRGVLAKVQDVINQTADSVSSAFGGDLFSAKNAGSFLANLTKQNALVGRLSGAFQTLLSWGWKPDALAQLFQSGNAGLILSLAGNRALATAGAQQLAAVQSGLGALGQQVGAAQFTLSSDKVLTKLDDLIAVCQRFGIDVGDEINGAAKNGKRKRKGKGKR